MDAPRGKKRLVGNCLENGCFLVTHNGGKLTAKFIVLHNRITQLDRLYYSSQKRYNQKRELKFADTKTLLMANVGIIGWGVVGQATGQGFSKKHSILWHDPYKEGGIEVSELVSKSEFIFVCVPTPMYHDYSGIDLSIVDGVVEKVAEQVRDSDRVVIIKSTVIPGTAKKIAEKHKGVRIVSNPEFLTESHPLEDFLNPNRTIIGGEDSDRDRVRELYTTILPQESLYFLTDTTSAEMAKYMSNVMLAAKTVVANEFYQLAQALGINYDDVRKMVEVDKRGGTHIKVPGPDGNFGFGGKCFPKDYLALLSLGRELGVDLVVLEKAWEKNLKLRRDRDWEKIAGAVSRKSAK